MAKAPNAAHLKAATTEDDAKSALADAKQQVAGDAEAAFALVEELTNEVVRLRTDLRAATKAREVLLASVAHDLRNPLNTFAMSVGLLRDDLESPDFERSRGTSLVTRMERAAVRMQRLIEDLLEASRVEAGVVEINAKPDDAAAVVRAAIEKAKPVATDKGATVEEGPIESGLAASFDRARVVDVLTKLVAVTLKSTGEGGVIRLGVEKHGAQLAFTVRGMAPRAKASTGADETRGGLSLLIARGIATAHGATLATETTAEGSRTLVLFPA